MEDARWVRRSGEATELASADPARPAKPSGSVVFFNYFRCQERASSASGLMAASICALFEPGDVTLLAQGLDEACSFLLQFGSVGPAKRRQMASVIIHHASRGMLDPHRLAIKAIVAVA